jgi:hypothetical protein
MVLLGGVIAIDTSVTPVTVNVVLLLMPPAAEAVIVADPVATAVATPEELIVATLVFDDFQVTAVVMSWVLLSEYVPVALN